MSYITTDDGTQIYYKDWGEGPVVTFSHGWPLSADAWDGQLHFLAQQGYRVIAHDRRGHGRSSQPSDQQRHGRVRRRPRPLSSTLSASPTRSWSATPPAGEKSPDTSAGTEPARSRRPFWSRRYRRSWSSPTRTPKACPSPRSTSCAANLLKDRSQFYQDLAKPFYGANREGSTVSDGVLLQFWLWSMQSGLRNAYASIKAFSETDFTEDLKAFDVPTLVLHGEDDQIVPVKDSAHKSAALIPGAKEIYYPGAPHGLTDTHADQFNADLLAFIKS